MPEQPEAPADEHAAEQPALTGAEPEEEAEEQSEELPEEQLEEPQEQAPEQMAAVSSLRMGDHGDAVAEMKTKLHYIGYYTGSLDGEFDVNTRSAVTAFQKARGLSQDEAVSMIVRGFLVGGIRGLPTNLQSEIDAAIEKANEGD